MKDEITDFFGNIENTNDFSIRKWINSETNNLDINMFCALSTEFNKYCIVRAIAQVTAPKKNNEFTKQLNEIRKNDNDFFNSFPLNYYKIEDNTIQYNRTTFKNGKIDFDYRDLISELSSFQNIMHELFEEIKSKEQTTAPPQQLEKVKKTEVKETVEHPEFDPNLWNKDCFELFKYLYECYYKTTKRQLTNIWFYLKENSSIKYNFKATKKEYIAFIFKYHIEIKNFDKAQTKWEDKECDTIDNHRINFEDILKQIAENEKNT